MAYRRYPPFRSTPSRISRMPGFSGAVQATTGTYAISGLCRSNYTRSDYYPPVGQVRVSGTLRSTMIDKHTLTIIDTLTSQANTCSFECFDFTPLRGQEVIVSLGT